MDFATFLSWGSVPTKLVATVLLVFKATLILLLAVAIAAGLRRASAGTRHVIWLVAIGSVLVLPVLAGWTPIDLKILPAPTPAQSTIVTRDVPSDVAPPTNTERTTESQAVGTVASPTRGTPRPGMVLFAVWAAVALLLLGRLIHGTLAVRRIVNNASPLGDDDWQARLYDVADRLGIASAPRILRSDDIRVPFAAGIVRATIVLPAECDEWTPGQRDAVLIHELGHVRRRDLLGHTLGRLACALYWFHPLVWTAARRLRDASERACDDLAIRLGSRPSEYADYLLRMVTATAPRAMPGVALAIAQRKEFEGRMLAILDPALRRDAPARWQSAALSGALVVLSLFVAAAAPAPRAAAPMVEPTHREATSDSDTIIDQKSGPAPAPDPRSRVEPPSPPAQPAPVSSTRDATIDEIQYDDVDQVRSGSPEVLARVLLNDSSAHVRRAAAWGLKQYVSVPVAIQALSQAATSDRDARVREMAVWAIEDSHDPNIIAILGDVLQGDDNDSVREMAAWALGSIRDPASAQILAQQLEREQADKVIGTLAWALGSIAADHAPPRLAELLTHPSHDIRLKAAWALSNIADTTMLAAVRDAVRQPQESVTMRALLRAWVAMDGSPDGLLELIDNSDLEVRRVAVGALAGSRFDPWPWPWPRPIMSP